MSTRLKCGVVLLAAGKSDRMGRPKLLLPWGTSSMIGHQIHTWQLLGATQITVVYAKTHQALRDELGRLNFPEGNQILNPQPELGMFSSIRCAAKWRGWIPGLTHWVVTLGDQPHLRLATLQALLRHTTANPNQVCQPRWLDRLCHPVILPKKYFFQLQDSPANTLREFLRSLSPDISGCEIEDPGLDFDIDTPSDYERALSVFLRACESGNDSRAPDSS